MTLTVCAEVEIYTSQLVALILLISAFLTGIVQGNDARAPTIFLAKAAENGNTKCGCPSSVVLMVAGGEMHICMSIQSPGQGRSQFVRACIVARVSIEETFHKNIFDPGKSLPGT